MQTECSTLYSIGNIRDGFNKIIAGNNDMIICDPRQLKESVPFREPCKINAFILVICSKGEGKLKINLSEFIVRPGMLFINFPENIIQIEKMSTDLEAIAIIISESFMQEIQTDIRNMVSLYMKFRADPYLLLSEQEQSILQQYITLARELSDSQVKKFQKESLFELSKSIAYRIAALIDEKMSSAFQVNAIPKSRKEIIFNQFMNLLTLYHKQERSVQFYASKLFINPKYLSTVIREYSGKTAAAWIDDFVILEAKALLKYSDKSIQEIAYLLNFPTQSFFGKYFKHHTGTSPGAYKMQQD